VFYNESSTTLCWQAAAADEKEAVIEAEKELEAAAAVRRAAFYSDPSSPSREVCGKHTLYAIHIRTDRQAPRRSIAYIQSRHVAMVDHRGVGVRSCPRPAQALGRAAGAHAALTKSLDQIKGLPTPAI